MGKTLVRQKKKAAAAAALQSSVKKTELGKSVPDNTSKLSAHVSSALEAKKWDEALKWLFTMIRKQKQPKLGSVQRWVRFADLAGDATLTAQLLDAVLRASGASSSQVPSNSEVLSPMGSPIIRHAPWVPGPPPTPTQPGTDSIPRFDPEHPTTTSGHHTIACSDPSNPSCHTLPANTDNNPTSTGNHTSAGTAGPPPQGRTEQSKFSSIDICPAHFSGRISVVSHQPAKERIPPSPYDLNLWASEPGAISVSPLESTSVTRIDVPFVPGAFVMRNVFSRNECAQLVAAAEAMGFQPDVDYTFSPGASGLDKNKAKPNQDKPNQIKLPMQERVNECVQIVAAAEAMGFQPDVDYTFSPGASGLDSAARNSAGGERAHGVVWLADESLQGSMYERCKPHLPQVLGGGALAGLNCRWRLYRYGSGAVYRPHVDGAWPGSGLKDGKYEFDAYGDRWSRLTFLLYLNEDFKGGSTTFYGPGPRPGTLDAHSVKPQIGNVLCFPHGDTMGSLVHEGSNVEQGTKYVLRTDVLYMLPNKASARAQAPRTGH
eukprot:gene25053-10702_t